MLNDILSDYLPILTQEERRSLALLYASLQRARSVTDLDKVFQRLLPLCLSDPNILNELLLTSVSKQIFGISLEEKSAENESFKTIRSEIIFRAMCIALGASQSPKSLFPPGTSELYWTILQVLPPSSFLTRLCHLLATLDAADILTEVPLIAGKEAEQLFHILVKHILGKVTDDDLRSGISIERFADIVYETCDCHTVLTDPSSICSINSPHAEISALEYIFEQLRSEEGTHHHFPVLLKDSEFQERVSVIILRGTTWKGESSEKLEEYVLCTGIEIDDTLEVQSPDQVCRSCIGVDIHFDSLGRTLIQTKELIRHISGVILLKTLAYGEFKTIEVLGDGSLLSKILSPLICDNQLITSQPELEEHHYDELEEDVEYTVTYITKEDSSPPPVLPQPIQSAIPSTPTITSTPEIPAMSDTKVNNTASEGSQFRQSSVISSAFWWGADPNKSYK